MRPSFNQLFKSDIQDIMTGYRAFSYRFVKTFPVLSQGFEIETEMSIHAVDKNLAVRNVVIDYRDRPDGSVSKLNTYTDGFKVLKTISKLFCTYRPLASIALALLLIAVVFMIPVWIAYMNTGLVERFPTLIVCGFAVTAAIQSLFSGLILENIFKKTVKILKLIYTELCLKNGKRMIGVLFIRKTIEPQRTEVNGMDERPLHEHL